MSTISESGSFTFETTVEKNKMLSLSEERSISWRVWNGAGMKEVEVVTAELRSSSQHYQDKSVSQLAQVVDDFQHLKVIEATKGIDTMVADQIESAKRTAQANRIENEAKRIIVEQAKAISVPPPDLKVLIPNIPKHQHFVPNYPQFPSSGWC